MYIYWIGDGGQSFDFHLQHAFYSEKLYTILRYSDLLGNSRRQFMMWIALRNVFSTRFIVANKSNKRIELLFKGFI